MKILIILLLCLITSPAQAKFMLTASNTYSQFKDKNYKIPSENTQSLSYGLSYNINKIRISVQSNRYLERNNKTYAVRKIDNKSTILKSKLTTDVLSAGYRVNRNIFGASIINVESKRKIDNYRKNNYSILYGINYSYILKKDILITLSLIAPNKELNLKGAGIVGINLLF
jgi:hypothetical protein